MSPSLSSVHSGSSQGSQAPGGMQYTYSSVHGGWPPVSSSYTVSSAPAAQTGLGNPHYNGRSSIYNQSSLHFSHPRSSQSPATGGEGLPPPPFDGVQQPFQTAIGGNGHGGGGGHGASSLSSTPQPPQSAILSSQSMSTQPPTPSSATAHVDSYTHTRAPSTPGYYTPTTTPQQPNFSTYTTQPSPPQHSPTTTGPLSRGLGSLSGPPAMAPPASYRSYSSYPLPTMGGGPVMSNVHHPGSQMAMIPGMAVQYNHHPMIYGHAQQPTQSERPFKCDQCVQSFSRNHDLKRHKRIHLAVKPFPCTYCSKSFSRKDALKVMFRDNQPSAHLDAPSFYGC